MRCEHTRDASWAPRLVLLALCWAAPASAYGAAPEPSADQTPLKDRARAQVRAASTAFAEGDYTTALVHYEAAMDILPAPKLHYNLGVCHQRLSLEAEDSEGRTRERDLAIQSYNAYLEQNPRADDRLEVAAVIRELGGTPATMPALKPLFEDEAPEPEPEPGPEPEPDIQSEPVTPAREPSSEVPDSATKAPPAPRHGRVGVSLLGGFSPALTGAQQLDAASLFALELYGGGMLGPKRRFLLAAHTLLYVGVGRGSGLARTSLPIGGYSIGLLGQQSWTLANKRLLLGAGLGASVTGQSVGQREGADVPSCRVDSGLQVAGHSGGAFASRFELGLLLGPRRRAVISVLLAPTIALFGEGPTGAECDPPQTPWDALGVDRRWQFQLWGGGGFSFRF